MLEKSDAQLLREFVAQKSETAFAEVAHRHANMVYSAALRQVRDVDGASHVAQSVFLDLARKARTLASNASENGSVGAWLYRATRFAAMNYQREERRRLSRERSAMQNFESPADNSPEWDCIAPLLDEAMAGLGENERKAILLRYFRNESFHTVGATLGVSDDTAQKRVSRGLEKLRSALARRGVTTTSAALTAALAVNAVQTAPAGAAAGWIGASLTGASMPSGATLTILKIMSMTKTQICLCAVIVGGLTLVTAVQRNETAKGRGEIQLLRQQVDGLAAQNSDLSNRLAQTKPTRSLPEDQLHELMRLRNEVGMLRDKTNASVSAPAEDKQWKIRAEAAEAELQFEATRARTVNAEKIIGLAAHMWANDHDGNFPTNFDTMSNELASSGLNFPLETFEMVNPGNMPRDARQTIYLREQNPRKAPDGSWERIYLLADGSVQTATSPDGSFDSWERNYSDPTPNPPQ